ncbi:FAD-binding and (Fe-S)-binding domain-containing protein [Actinomadura sp. 3N407]|uniref:FAD-binding and (Fe-S)-binding domain-containing protein n=1 Tax=Actinomadura sp. 3N407 TaxID=3457423 RepID=UPI003FCE91B1
MATTRAARTQEVPAKTDPSIPGALRGRQTIAVRELSRALRKAVKGEVRFDAGSKAMYANDASNFRQVPIGVVIPRTLDDVVAVHRICERYGAPVLNRGGGTSLSGETVNHAVVIDHSKYLTRIAGIDVDERRVTCEPGVINEELNRYTGRWNLVFGPDPSSHSRCVIGGNIGNNSCGIHSVQSQLYGPGPRTSDNVHAMEVVTYGGDRFWVGVNEEEHLDDIIAAGGRKGEIYAALRDLRERYADAIRAGFPSVAEMPRRVSGFNLDELLPENGFNVARALVGTESTCATALRSVLLLTPALFKRTLVVVEYDELADAAENCSEIVERFRPIGLEALDHRLIEDQQMQNKNVPDIEELPRQGGGAWLLVQFGADTAEESLVQAERFTDWLTREKRYAPDRMVTVKSAQEGGWSGDLWAIREAGLGSTAFPPGEDHWPGWEDSAVPPPRVGEYTRALRRLMDRHGIEGAMYGHFAQGCIHSRMSFDLRSTRGIARYRAFMQDAADLVASNNHFHTDVGVACVEAIEAAGWRVIMPEGHVCCGRPLYDYGFLSAAERYLHRVLDVLRPHIRAGTPVVGMEPSCLAVFKDELTQLLPHDDDAARLAAASHHFAEFFQAYGITPPKLSGEGKALLWGHCHHRATGGMDPEKKLLEQMGLDTESLKGGCCGLAGSWGFESGKYDISMDCGEQALLPAVREAEDTTSIVANGFSCRTQIEHAKTGRRALHVAQLMQLVRDQNGRLPPGRPERIHGDGERKPAPPMTYRAARVSAVAAACGAAAFAADHALRRRSAGRARRGRRGPYRR